MKSKIAAVLGTIAAFSLPVLAMAQSTGALDNLITFIERTVGRAIPILVALALIYFIIGLIRFVIAADAEKREDGKKMMWWGIVALFVIVSIWGIVSYLGNILGISQQSTANPPCVAGLPCNR